MPTPFPAKTTYAFLPESFLGLAVELLRANPHPDPGASLLRTRVRPGVFLPRLRPRVWPQVSLLSWGYQVTGCPFLRSAWRLDPRNSTARRFWRSCLAASPRWHP